MLDPMKDDLGANWNRNRPQPRKHKEEPAETYKDRDERQRRIDSIWGPPEKLPKPKNSRIN